MPIAAAHREFTVKVDGRPIGREHQLLSVMVTKEANRIPAARLVYQDGAASAGDFPLSNGALLVPGKVVEILAGPNNQPVRLFKGLVIRQSLKVREHSAPQLVVECRHQAVKLSVGRKSAYYFDQKDSDIIADLLERAALDADVEATALSHKQQVQYDATDWDFLVSRAEANGLLLLAGDDKITVTKPQHNGTSVATLNFGSTILDLDVQMDCRGQFAAVKSVSWDAAQQALIERDGSDPGNGAPGNLDSAALADVIGLPHYRLQSTGLNEAEAQAWADARWRKSKFSKVGGRIKCEGIGTIHPGDVVTLTGIGERFSGAVLVTGLRHDFDTVQGWKTHVQFGGIERSLAEEFKINTPQAGGLLPAISGLQVGVVVSNEDPDGEERVRVRMPLVNNAEDGTWARVAALDSGKERGFFFRPEIGDEVVLGFFNDDPRHAVVLGMLHSSAKAAPWKGSDDNHEKGYQSRSKMKIYFHDDKKIMEFATPAGNQLTLSEDDKSVKLADQNGNKIELTQDGITIESSKAIVLKAATEVKLESGTSFNAKGGTELKLEGMAGAELSSSAATKVRGALLQLN